MELTNAATSVSGYSRWVGYCAYLCFAIWGMGQLAPFDWWYVHGITIGDVLFLLCVGLGFATDAPFRKHMIAVTRAHWPYVLSVTGMMLALLLSIWVNSALYEISPYYVISTLRTGYFLLLSLAIIVWARYASLAGLCRAYLVGLILGISTILLQTWLPEARDSGECSLPVLLNPNVTGNMMGVGIIMMTILVLDGRFPWAFTLTPFFVWASLYTFSKGAWGMVILTLLALFFAVWHVLKLTPESHKARLGQLQFTALVAVLAGMMWAGYDEVTCFVRWKLDAQAVNGSLEARVGMLSDAVRIAAMNPVGVGTGRYAELATPVDKPEWGGFVGHSSRGNPHSAFLYVLINGGIGALVLFLAALAYPFLKLWQYLPRTNQLKLFLIFAMMTFALSGTFQLQLFSQHYFWIFTGLTLALADGAHRFSRA